MSHALAQEFFTTSTTWEALLKRDIISNRLFCCCSVVKSCPTLCNPCTAAHQAPLSFTISWSLSKLMSTELMMLSYHLILCHSLLLLPSIFPASWSFQMSQLFASRGQHIGASASALPMNIQDWFPLGLTGLISLQSKWLSRVSNNKLKTVSSSVLSFLYGPALTSIHDYWKKP